MRTTEVCPSLKHLIDPEIKLDLKYFGYMEYTGEHGEILRKLLIRDHQLKEDLIQLKKFEVGCFMIST